MGSIFGGSESQQQSYGTSQSSSSGSSRQYASNFVPGREGLIDSSRTLDMSTAKVLEQLTKNTEITRADTNPYLKAGYDALDKLNQSLTTDQSGLAALPGYQFQMDQGRKAIESSASAKGYLGSGRQATEIQNYAQGLAASSLKDYQATLLSIAGLGQSAYQTNAAAGTTAATTGAGIIQQNAETKANNQALAGGEWNISNRPITTQDSASQSSSVQSSSGSSSSSPGFGGMIGGVLGALGGIL